MQIENATEWLSEDVVAILPASLKKRLTDLHIQTLREPGTNLSDMSYFRWSMTNTLMTLLLPSRKRVEDSYTPLERLVHNEWLSMKRNVCYWLVQSFSDENTTRNYGSFRVSPRHTDRTNVQAPETFTGTIRMPAKHKTATQRIPTVDEVLVDLAQARNRLSCHESYRAQAMARLVADQGLDAAKDRRRIAILEKRLAKAQRHAAKSTNGV